MNWTENPGRQFNGWEAPGNTGRGHPEDHSPDQQTLTTRQSLDAAVQHHAAGRLPQAENIYRQILQGQSGQPEALHLLGVIAHQTGKNEAGINLITRAIAIRPDYAEAHYNLGNALKELGRFDEAVAGYDEALNIKPDLTEAHNNLGLTFQELGKPDKAVACYQKALSIRPDYAEAHNNLGLSLQKLGKLDDAVTVYNRALSIKPDFAEANYNLGNVLKEMGQPNEAVASYRNALAIRPDYAEAHNNLGIVLRNQGKSVEAVASHKKALAIRPDYAEAHSNLGNVLEEMGKLDEAVASYQKAVAIKPDFAEAYNNLGFAFRSQGKSVEAVASHKKALAIRPDYADAHCGRALALLSIGDFDEGLAEYEWRKEKKDNDIKSREFPIPLWNGDPLPGEQIFVWKEQGIGDQILYGGLLQNMAVKDTTFALEVDSRLSSLFSRATHEIDVLPPDTSFDSTKGKIEDRFAAHIPIASLMLAKSPWPKNYKPKKRYLETDPQLVESWQKLLEEFGDDPKIGISWRSATERISPRKSLPIELWGPILNNREAVFVNLQYGETDAELSELNMKFGVDVYTDPDLDRYNNIEGLASLIDSLDLIITTSNIVPHLAAALGKPCWLMLQKVPIWYWGLEGTGNIFYPSIHCYRQESSNNWSTVVDEVAADLDTWVTARSRK